MRWRFLLGVAAVASGAAVSGALAACGGDPGAGDASTPGPGRPISTADLAGWRQGGAGRFDVSVEDGDAVYTSRGGLGLLWYEERLADFEVTLELQVPEGRANSGVFVRVPDPTDEAYVFESFEVQIDTGGEGTAATGAIYDVQAPIASVELRPGVWHRMRVRAEGPRIRAWIDGVLVNDFRARTGGKVRSYALEGYLGLQNHSEADVVRFRRVRVREL